MEVNIKRIFKVLRKERNANYNKIITFKVLLISFNLNIIFLQIIMQFNIEDSRKEKKFQEKLLVVYKVMGIVKN